MRKKLYQKRCSIQRKREKVSALKYLDEKMQSWGRKKFGDRYAHDLWRNELLERKSLKLGTDELYDFAFN